MKISLKTLHLTLWFIASVSLWQQAIAQNNILPDNTLPIEEQSQVLDTPVNTPGSPIDTLRLIQGGAERGQNLFHSFSAFNIADTEAAYFITLNPDIENIISRVTGNDTSDILGLLGAVKLDSSFMREVVDLYFINPNGVFFGPASELDVTGALIVSTATDLQFSDEGIWGTTNAMAPSSLLVVDPSAFLFNDPGINGSITNFGDLQAVPGNKLVFLGGDINFNGGSLVAPGGEVVIGGIKSLGTIRLSEVNNASQLDFSDNAQLSDISLIGSSRVGGSQFFIEPDGGRILVRGDDITLDDASYIFSFIFGQADGHEIDIKASELNLSDFSYIETTLIFSSATGGSINIDASNLTLDNFSEISSEVLGDGRSGDINISSETVAINGQSSISTSTFDSGNSGNISITASDVNLQGTTENGRFSSGIFSRVSSRGTGDGGDISVEADRITIVDGAKISTEVLGDGQGGDIFVSADESLRVLGRSSFGLTPSAISARTEGLTVEANAGSLTILTPKLVVTDGAQLSASTFGPGNAGELLIDAEEIKLSGTSINGFPSGVFAQSNRSTGNSSDIFIDSHVLEILNGAQISAAALEDGIPGDIIIFGEDITVDGTSSFDLPSRILTQTDGSQDAGNLTIITDKLSITDGGEISAGTGSDSEGMGGTILIEADQLLVSGRSSSGLPSNLSAATLGRGQAGDIEIYSDNVIVANGAFISSLSLDQGDAGNIFLDSNSLVLLLDSFISSQSVGTGDASNITINLSDTLFMVDGSIRASSSQAAGGIININADRVRLIGDSDIQTNVDSGVDDAGSITIEADSIVAFDDSDILAFAADGRGGNITLKTNVFFGEDYQPNSPAPFDENDRVDINATGSLASGNILLPDVSFIENSLNELPDELVNSETLVANSCIVRGNDTASSFVLTGSDGLASNPRSDVVIPLSLDTVKPIADSAESFNGSILLESSPISEPSGVYQLADGRLVLSQECR
ncbi:S-layer family protein [Leptothoe sp. ISB3NOV94-8A]